MFEFAWPWIFLLAPLPWLLRALLPAADSGEAALKVSFLNELEGLSGQRARAYLVALAQVFDAQLAAGQQTTLDDVGAQIVIGLLGQRARCATVEGVGIQQSQSLNEGTFCHGLFLRTFRIRRCFA